MLALPATLISARAHGREGDILTSNEDEMRLSDVGC